MAKLNGKITTLKDFEKKLQDKVFTSRAAQSAFKDKIFPIVAESINEAIDKSQSHFKPIDVGGIDLAGQLGVGIGGQPDTDKLNNAWKILQVIGKPTAVSSLKLSLSKGSKFATFDFTINKDAFYDHFRTNYISLKRASKDKDSNVTTVAWMKNFLIGIPTIDGYGYIDSSHPKFKDSSSRTGIGHMVKVKIPSRQFELKGYGEDKAFGAIFANIKKQFKSRAFTDELVKKISKATGSRKKNA